MFDCPNFFSFVSRVWTVRTDVAERCVPSGSVAAGVPFQAPEHDAAVRVRERAVVRHRARPGAGLLAVEARRRRQPRLCALHSKHIYPIRLIISQPCHCCVLAIVFPGHRGRCDLVLPADLGDREERAGVPVHVDAAEPGLHHGHRLVRAGRGRQPRKVTLTSGRTTQTAYETLKTHRASCPASF
jgi:hypothetical protein